MMMIEFIITYKIRGETRSYKSAKERKKNLIVGIVKDWLIDWFMFVDWRRCVSRLMFVNWFRFVLRFMFI